MAIESENNKKIAKNTLALYLRMFLVLIVGLYTSRVVLQTLGVEDYGIYNVVAGFVSLFGFLNATLASSMQRFYNFNIGQSDFEGVTRVYNVGLIIHVVLAVLIVVILETIGLWYINNIMVLPAERLRIANLVFHLSVLSMFFVILQIPYTGALLAFERMNFYAFISILDVFLRLGAVILLSIIPWDKLSIYAILLSLISIIDFVITFTFTLSKIPYLKFRKVWDKNLFVSMLSFSGWNLLGTFAFLLKGQGINMVINVFTGPIVNAARGVACQVQSAVNGFSSNIAVAFRPQIVNNYASGNVNRSLRLMFLESKVCYSLLCILVVPLVIEMHYVLHLWLGDTVPENTETFAALVLIDMMVCSLNTPLTHIAHATGNIKNYQIACSCVNILLVPACWILMRLGLNATSTFICTIVFSILNQTVCLIMLHKIIDYSSGEYIKYVLVPCLSISLLLPIVPYFIHTLMAESFLRLTVVCVIDLFVAFFLANYGVLNKSERSTIKGFVYKKLKR